MLSSFAIAILRLIYEQPSYGPATMVGDRARREPEGRQGMLQLHVICTP
jgi:hypothetical protein